MRHYRDGSITAHALCMYDSTRDCQTHYRDESITQSILGQGMEHFFITQFTISCVILHLLYHILESGRKINHDSLKPPGSTCPFGLFDRLGGLRSKYTSPPFSLRWLNIQTSRQGDRQTDSPFQMLRTACPPFYFQMFRYVVEVNKQIQQSKQVRTAYPEA